MFLPRSKAAILLKFRRTAQMLQCRECTCTRAGERSRTVGRNKRSALRHSGAKAGWQCQSRSGAMRCAYCALRPRKERLAARRARQIQSTQHQQLRALDGVAGEAKIPDIYESVTGPLQQNEICRSSRRIARIEHKRSRAPVDESRNKTPVRNAGIVAKVVA